MKAFLLILALVLTGACSAEAPTPAETPNPVTPTLAASSPQATATSRPMSPEDAVRAVMTSPESGWGLFPTSVGSQACQIRGGGPAPGILVPGTCRTEIETRGSGYSVKFTELWDAGTFHYATEPGSGELHHSWSFLVSATGAVIPEASAGHFPPQYVR
jgi:hypothetical protein